MMLCTQDLAVHSEYSEYQDGEIVVDAATPCYSLRVRLNISPSEGKIAIQCSDWLAETWRDERPINNDDGTEREVLREIGLSILSDEYDCNGVVCHDKGKLLMLVLRAAVKEVRKAKRKRQLPSL